RDPGRLLRCQAVLAERDRVAALGETGHPAAHDLAMLDASRHQHRLDPSADGGLGRGELPRSRSLRSDVAAIDPDLDADPAVGRVGVDLAVADVGPERAQRDAT